MSLTIRVHGLPAPQGSKRGYVRGGKVAMVESSAKVKPWREAVKWAVLEAEGHNWTPLTGPVAIGIVFILKRPRGHYGTGRSIAILKASAPAWPAVRPDLDKLVRSTLDGLGEAGVWRDDSQAVRIGAEKVYGDGQGARIHIVQLPATVGDGDRECMTPPSLRHPPLVVPSGRHVEDVAVGGELR